MRPTALFKLMDVTVTISPAGLASFAIVIAAAAWLAAAWLKLDPGQALVAGTLSAAVMFVSELLHQFGHAYAARRVGYPMRGIHFFSILAASRYPADEPPLPRRTHTARALGGFWVNVVIGLLLAPYGFVLWLQGGVAGWVMALAAVYNFFVLGLGAFVPIHIPGVLTTDGATLLRLWWADRPAGDEDGQ